MSQIQARCKHDIVAKWRKQIAEIGLPREIPVMANGHEVFTNKNNKMAIKGRFYPRNDLRKLITQQAVEEILNHDCPTYCDWQRGIIEKLEEDSPWADEPRLASNKNPELSRTWAEQICASDGTSGAVTIFSLLVLIRRPLLIVGFLDRNVTDQGFEQLVDLLVDGPGIFDYWRHFHDRETALSEKAAETFRKQMWSFVPPKISVNINKITTQSFRRERILPFIEQPKLLGNGGYSSVYRVKLHEDYCSVPEKFKAEAYALKQITERSASPVEIKKEIETLRLVQSNPHEHIIRFLAVYEHVSLKDSTRPPAWNFLMPLMTGNLREFLRGEGPFEDTAQGLAALVGGKLYKQVIGIVGALHHMVHSIKMHRIDLKPDNILVKREQDGSGGYNDILILADFGQARVKRPRNYTKPGMAVTFSGAITDAYAPPEAFESAWGGRGRHIQVLEDKWDVWPLGCIFVEILTFLALGQLGVHKLDREREGRLREGLPMGPDADMDSDCRFWITEPSKNSRSGHEPTLKKSITRWLDHLASLKFDHTEIDAPTRTKCRDFMAWNIILTRAMLNPWPSMHISTRRSIGEIVTWLKSELLADMDSLLGQMDTASIDRLFGTPIVASNMDFPVGSIIDKQIVSSPKPAPAPVLRSSTNSSTSTLAERVGDETAGAGDKCSLGHGDSGSLSRTGSLLSRSDTFGLGPGLFDLWPEEVPKPGTDENTQVDAALEPYPGEFELLQMSGIGYHVFGHTGKGRIMICHTSQGPGYDLVIRTRGDDEKRTHHNLHILRDKTSIVPLHIVSPQFLKSYNQSIGQTPDYVVQVEGDRISPGTGFHTSNLTHMSNLFEVLTQQRVLTEMRLKKITLRHEKRNLLNLFHHLHDLTYKAVRAEIWIEIERQKGEMDHVNVQEMRPELPKRANTDAISISHFSMADSVTSSGNKSLGLSDYGAFPATRRLVIYCRAVSRNPYLPGADTIFSIKFDGGLLPERSDGSDPNVLRVYRAKVVHGTHRDQVSVCKVSQIDSQHDLPGVPMSPLTLCTQELANESRCSSVDLEFYTRQDAVSFSIAFHREYQQYADELRANER